MSLRDKPRSLSLLLLSLVGLTAVGLWTHSVVRKTVRDRTEDRLRLVMNAMYEGLNAWLEGQHSLVRWIAAEPAVRDDLLEIARHAPGLTAEQLRRLPARGRLVARLHDVLESHGYENFAFVSPEARILTSNDPTLIGTTTRVYSPELLARLSRGETVTAPPFALGVVDSSGIPLGRTRPVILTASPVFATDSGSAHFVGFFDVRADPGTDFDPIITAGRPGATGETYFFSQEGLLLSTSRFDSLLRKVGLLPRDTLVGSPFNVRVGDPGGNLLLGFDPATPPPAWPLTHLAESAVTGHDGIDIDGYRSYLGETVVGTWRWFPKAAVGIAVEQGYDESYRGVRILWQAFSTLFGIIVVGTGIIWLVFGMLERARARARRAEQLGQYTLERLIGEGAMGSVYRARHAFLRRATAVKLLRSDRSTPQALRRFEKEVQATSQLVHPNTITIFDYGRTPGGTFYYAMEYLRGLTLDVVVQRFGPLPERRVANIMRQVCGSLAEAHDAGLIHRDIKPQNIMICYRGGVPDLVKVLDFGLVKESLHEDPDLTRDGAAVGTPLYMAPEAASASLEIDARADLYSLGVVAYFLLSGVQPFFGVNAREVMRRHMEERPLAPSEKLGHPLAPEMEDLVLKLLAKDPESRPPTARAVEEMLDEVIDPILGRWTDEEGDEWWRANAPQLIGSDGDGEPGGPPVKLDVDVESRAGRL